MPAISIIFTICRRDEITPLNGLSGTRKDRAKAKNNAFIAKRRCNARKLLQAAHDAGRLPFQPVQVATFSRNGTVENPVDLESSEDEA